MPDRRIRIIPILLEAFFVVLGVFLALAANQWREDANARERADLAQQSIVEELEANREALRESSAFNMALLDSLRAYFPADSPPLPPSFFQRGFFRPASVFTTAWDAARAADAVSQMPYADVLRFSKLYATQAAYKMQAETIGSLLYAEMMEKGYLGVSANYRNLASVLTGLTFYERFLAGEYDRVLAVLDSTASAGAFRP